MLFYVSMVRKKERKEEIKSREEEGVRLFPIEISPYSLLFSFAPQNSAIRYRMSIESTTGILMTAAAGIWYSKCRIYTNSIRKPTTTDGSMEWLHALLIIVAGSACRIRVRYRFI
jgi:hypothetical protein